MRPPAEGAAVNWSVTGAAAGPDDRIQILRVHGELDLATADRQYRRGRAAIGRHARLLLLDLTGLSFCDASGLSAFVRIADEAETAGCRYGLIAPRPLVVKMLRITGLDKQLRVFATVEEACLRLMALTAAVRGR